MNYRRTAVTSLVLIVAATLAGAAPTGALASAVQDDTFPDTADAAMELYESWVEDWLDGPVEYIILDEERDVWDDLETDEQRRAFKEYFWERRDDDPRDREHPFRREFYERVAHANQRFRGGYPRGWRSDRGRVWITLGRPDAIRHSPGGLGGGGRRGDRGDFTTWIYHTMNRPFSVPFGELQVYFLETQLGQHDIYDPKFGAQMYPYYLRETFDIVRESVILDPTLEFDPDTSTTEFVEATVGGELPLEVPGGVVVEPGAAGSLAVPVRLALRDLLFRPSGERLEAEIQVRLSLEPEGGGDPIRKTETWRLSLSEAELAEHGNESLQSMVVVEAPPSTYRVRVDVEDALATSAGAWEGSLEVGEDGTAVTAPQVGSTIVSLSDEGGETGLLSRPGEPVRADRISVIAWVRGRRPVPEEVRLALRDEEGATTELTLVETEWRGGPAGPLTMVAELPEDLTAGDYVLVLTVGELGVRNAEISIR